ncbi:MAG: polyamine aminopropyltransferase [Burkholderiales bacterium]
MTKLRLHERLTDSAGVYFDATSCIASHQSAYQLIEIYACPDLGRLMRIDGVNMTSERDEFFYHEGLIHLAATAHPNPQRALIIGGGDGGAAEELLKQPISHCTLCELDADVVRLSREYLPSIHGDTFDDPRLVLHIGDGAAFVKRAAATATAANLFDLIYLDLTDPAGEAAPLYGPPFFADCKAALADSGALVLHIGSPFAHPDRARATIANLRTQFSLVTPYFVDIPTYGGTWGFAVASMSLDVRSLTASEIDSRLNERGIRMRRFYNGEMHCAMQAQPEHVRRLLA